MHDHDFITDGLPILAISGVSVLQSHQLAVSSVFGLLEWPTLQAQPGHHLSHSNMKSSKLGILQCEEYSTVLCVWVCTCVGVHMCGCACVGVCVCVRETLDSFLRMDCR